MEKTKIRFDSDDNLKLYSNIIESHLSAYGPQFEMSCDTIKEAILNAYINSGKIRLGPAPDIKQKYHMLQVIEKYTEQKLPIPILVASGPMKAVKDESIDLAEFSALSILSKLNLSIKKYYSPGIHVNIRLEDLTGTVLEPVSNIPSMQTYIKDFEKLIRVLGMSDFITPIRESQMGKTDSFYKITDKLSYLFVDYVQKTNTMKEELWVQTDEFQKLKAEGWSGIIPLEQREMYIQKYKMIHPGINTSDSIDLMSRYFASSLARKQLKMKGDFTSWGGDFLEIGFMPPVRGYNYNTRVYYRSIDIKNTKLALPYWRSKGFLKIDNDNHIKLSNVHWRDAENMEFEHGFIILERDNESVQLKCDVLLNNNS